MKENTQILKAGYNMGMAYLMLKDAIGRLELILEKTNDDKKKDEYQDVINQIQSACLFIDKCTE